MISRVDKFVREVGRTPSLREANDARRSDIALLVGPATEALLIRPAVALALRCFSGAVIISPLSGMDDGLIRQAQTEADSYGEPDRLKVCSAPDSAIRLGLASEDASVARADASGWMSGVNTAFALRQPATAPAATFAVAAAFGKLFARIIGRNDDVLGEAWTMSLLPLGGQIPAGPPPTSLQLGRTSILGSGAIGSSLAYVLYLSGWGASLRFIDSDRYDDVNAETTLLISKHDAQQQCPKAETLAARAARPGLETTFERTRVRANDPELSRTADAFVCAVDNEETRCFLDHNAAPLLLNAGVGGTPDDAGHVLVSRHAAGDPSLGSLYKHFEDIEIVRTASELPTDVPADECSRLDYEGVALAAPFVALAAGALLAAQMVAWRLNVRTEENYFKLALLNLQGKYLSMSRRNVDAS